MKFAYENRGKEGGDWLKSLRSNSLNFYLGETETVEKKISVASYERKNTFQFYFYLTFLNKINQHLSKKEQ